MGINKSGGLIEINDQAGKFTVSTELRGKIFKRRSKWISYCESLELSTCGETKAKAIANMQEAILLFFEVCLEKETLGLALSELGWKLVSRGTDEKTIKPEPGLRIPKKLALPVELLSPAVPGINLPIPKNVPPAFVINQVKGKNWKGHLEIQ